jgi:hypothetical protein
MESVDIYNTLKPQLEAVKTKKAEFKRLGASLWQAAKDGDNDAYNRIYAELHDAEISLRQMTSELYYDAAIFAGGKFNERYQAVMLTFEAEIGAVLYMGS